jgi:hypothetical protein
MKKNFIILAMTFWASFTFGQATLEHSYNSDWTSNQNNWGALESNGGVLNAFNVETGIYYYTLEIPWNSLTTNIMRIYNEQHSLVKTINLPTRPNRINFITDKLFNQDNLIEILYNDDNNLILINENSNVIQTIQDRQFARIIKTVNNNYKLLASANSQENTLLYDVYSLSGTLSTLQEDTYLNKSFIGYPNPTESTINISNKLPKGEKGVLEIFDSIGKIVITRNVIGGNNEIEIDTSKLSNGTYIYKLNGETNKFIKK